MEVTLLSITPDAELLIEQAARTCYNSINKITNDSHINFIQRLVKMGHESVLEHASATFRIKGISRACSHQLVRHRIASYSQRSQRYVSEENFSFVMPRTIIQHREAGKIFCNVISHMKQAYNELLELGIKKEDARYILPNACTTEIVMTANMREWKHFLKLRLSKKAQYEIRQLAKEILHILKDYCPNVFKDFVIN